MGWNNTTLEVVLCPHEHVNYNEESVIVLGFCAFPVIVCGVFACLLSIRIFTHPVMLASPINWYLAVLSTSDLLVLMATFFMLCLPRLGEWLGAFAAYRASLFASPYMYPTGATAQTVSVYMTVLMSAHRFIGVCFPFRAGGIITKTRVKIAIGSLVFFALTFNFSRFFEVYVDRECYDPSIEKWSVLIDMTAIRRDVFYQFVFFGLGQTILMFVIPFSALIILNSKIIHAVHRTRKQHECMQTDDSAKKAELSKEISTSIMLVGIVVVFLTCNSLSFLSNILEVGGYPMYTSWELSVLVDTSNLLVSFNAAINICVYLLFSEKYRTLLRYYVSCGWLHDGEVLVTEYH